MTPTCRRTIPIAVTLHYILHTYLVPDTRYLRKNKKGQKKKQVLVYAVVKVKSRTWSPDTRRLSCFPAHLRAAQVTGVLQQPTKWQQPGCRGSFVMARIPPGTEELGQLLGVYTRACTCCVGGLANDNTMHTRNKCVYQPVLVQIHRL